MRLIAQNKILLCVVLGSAGLSSSCDQASHETSDKQTAAAAKPFEPLASYPPRRWRLAREKLNNVVLSLSHILVTYDHPRPDSSALRAPGWRAERDTDRTRPEAIKRAKQIAIKAHAHPEKFGDLAAKWSDDLASRDRGGRLGTWSAALMFEEFLDALATMQPRETSRVVETDMGFHVLKRQKTPPEEKVSASQIVIRYKNTAQFDVRDDREIDRSRDEAKALATKVAAEAQASPESFAELVAKHSEHADVIRNGDIGVWSTHDAFVNHREIDVISRLSVGEVSDPVDSFIGFRIFRRTPVEPRAELAVKRLAIRYSPSGTEPRPRAKAKELVARLHTTLNRHPDRFSALQEEHCCKGVKQWSQGRGDPELEHVAKSLPIGGMSAPLERDDSFEIIRRVEPESKDPESEPSTKLPKPAAPDIEHWVRNITDPAAFSEYIGKLGKEVDRRLGPSLDDARRQHLQNIFAQLQTDMASEDPDERLRALSVARAELRNLLGGRGMKSLQRLIQTRVIKNIAPEFAARHMAQSQ